MFHYTINLESSTIINAVITNQKHKKPYEARKKIASKQKEKSTEMTKLKSYINFGKKMKYFHKNFQETQQTA